MNPKSKLCAACCVIQLYTKLDCLLAQPVLVTLADQQQCVTLFMFNLAVPCTAYIWTHCIASCYVLQQAQACANKGIVALPW